MLKSYFSGKVWGQWTLRTSSMRKTWILRFHRIIAAQPVVRPLFWTFEAVIINIKLRPCEWRATDMTLTDDTALIQVLCVFSLPGQNGLKQRHICNRSHSMTYPIEMWKGNINVTLNQENTGVFTHRTWCRCSARKLKLPTPRLSLCGSNNHSSLAKVSTSFNIRSTNFVTNVHSFKYALVQHPECILLITEMCCSFTLGVNLIRCWFSGYFLNSQSKFAWSISHTCNCYQIETRKHQSNIVGGKLV